MSELEISPKFGKRIKVATWCTAVMGVLLFYVFGYFPLVMWVAAQTSLLDGDRLGGFIKTTLIPLIWLSEIFPEFESYCDQFIPSV